MTCQLEEIFIFFLMGSLSKYLEAVVDLIGLKVLDPLFLASGMKPGMLLVVLLRVRSFSSSQSVTLSIV